MKVDSIIKALGSTNSCIFDAIKDAGEAQVGRNDIPSIIALWCEYCFTHSSRTFKQRVDRALRKAGWPTDSTPLKCVVCKGTGTTNYGSASTTRICYNCGGRGNLPSFVIPVTVRRTPIQI